MITSYRFDCLGGGRWYCVLHHHSALGIQLLQIIDIAKDRGHVALTGVDVIVRSMLTSSSFQAVILIFALVCDVITIREKITLYSVDLVDDFSYVRLRSSCICCTSNG